MAALEKGIAPTKNEMVNSVMAKIEALQGQKKLALPPNYSAENALMSAYLKLQGIKTKDDKPVLQACTPDSIANSLLDMVIQGLNPAKNQCYFIPYGNMLTLQRSYFGTAAVAMRVTKAPRLPFAACVFEGDEFQYEIVDGNTRVVKHVQKFESINKDKIIGAYCTVYLPDGGSVTEVMTINQIKQAWMQSRQRPFDEKGNLRPDSTHFKFADEMAKKTVLTRGCKMAINSSDDSTLDLVVESVNRTDEAAEEAALEDEVQENANAQTIDADYVVKPDSEEDTSAAGTENTEKPAETKGESTQPKQEPKPDPKPQRKDRGF
jgi:recombination protein RecT